MKRLARLDLDAALLGVVTIWGANVTISKVALTEIHPLAFSLARFTILLVVSGLTILFFQPLPKNPHRSWPLLLFLGFLGHAAYAYCFAVGLGKTSSFHSSLIISSSPIFIALFSLAMRVEKVRGRQWLGLLLAFLGLTLFIRSGTHDTGANWIGDVITLGGTLCWAFFTTLCKPLLRHERPLHLNTLTVAMGWPFMVAYAGKPFLEQDWHISTQAWLCLLYSALFPIFIAYIVWSWALAKIGPVRASAYAYLVPVVTALLSFFWLGEKLTLHQAAAASVVLVGMGLTRK